MKRLFGLATFAAILALPAHAQTSRGTSGGAAMTPSTTNYSGGGGGGFSGGGSIGGAGITKFPRTQFGVAAVSGSLQDYIPSTFVAYDEALAEGRDLLANSPKTVVEAAHNQAPSSAQKARISLIQDVNGNPIIVAR